MQDPEELLQDEDTQEELYEHFNITVDKGQEPVRIDKFLTARIQNASRTRIQACTETESIRVNDKPVKSNYKIKPLDVISILLPHPPRDKELKAENIPLDIIYEDDHVMVVNKSAGMVVHPGYHNYDHTLVNALMYHFENLPTANGERRPGLVHRIDKDTSGLLVIAKDEYSMSHLAKQFFEHTVIRNYVALVWGYLEEENGTITGNLARSKHDRRIMQVYEDEEIGKHAVTHYKVLERFNYATLVECTLETGRTHQIRIHMKHIRHPLFNDAAYGGNEIKDGPSFTKFKQFIDNCFSICPRQALHARTLGFVHPHTKKEMLFELPPPADMQLLIEKWRHYTSFKEREGE
ncbi:MAG: RluA family pseudouridine synthase [Bacteroidetes bacterium]|nr:RluA family pseudouridine synthase [Bacteroidota bacterium]